MQIGKGKQGVKIGEYENEQEVIRLPHRVGDFVHLNSGSPRCKVIEINAALQTVTVEYSGVQGEVENFSASEACFKRADNNSLLGWIEPACDNPQWIAWLSKQGDLILYTNRASNGAVQGEPIVIRARGKGNVR